ncbi:putative DBINO protein [Hordeum vulgare]|nr:putative DBINO protein [Hordeum vulgare]
MAAVTRPVTKKKGLEKLWPLIKVRHENEPFTVTHCWPFIKYRPKFRHQYAVQVKKKKRKAFVAGNEEDMTKRPRGKTNSKIDEKRDSASFALQET